MSDEVEIAEAITPFLIKLIDDKQITLPVKEREEAFAIIVLQIKDLGVNNLCGNK